MTQPILLDASNRATDCIYYGLPFAVFNTNGVVYRDGTTPLTAQWNAGNYVINSQNSVQWKRASAYASSGTGTYGDPWVSATGTGGIQEAYAAAMGSGIGGTVYVPKGYYLITKAGGLDFTANSSSNLDPNSQSSPGNAFSMIGDGMMNTFLIGANKVGTTGVVIDCSGSGGVTLQGFSIIQNGTNPSTVGILLARSTVGMNAYSEQNTVESVFISLASSTTANGGYGTIGIYNNAAETCRYLNDWVFADTPVYITSSNSFGIVSAFVPAPGLFFATTNQINGGLYHSLDANAKATTASVVLEGAVDNTKLDAPVLVKAVGAATAPLYAVRILGTSLVNNFTLNTSQIENYDGVLFNYANLYGAKLQASFAQTNRAAISLQGTGAGLYGCEINLSPGSVNPPSQPLISDDGVNTTLGVRNSYIHLYKGQTINATKTFGIGNLITQHDSGSTQTWAFSKAGFTLGINGLELGGTSLMTGRVGIGCANGVNNDINPGTAGFGSLLGPTAPFSITGIISGSLDGRDVVLYNATAYLVTLANENGGSTAANRIHTSLGKDYTLCPGGGVHLRWESSLQRWIIVASTPTSPTVIGSTVAPLNSKLLVTANATAYTNDDSEAIAQFVGADGASTKLNLDAFASQPTYFTRYANGTSGAKTSTQNSANMGAFGARGFETNAYFDAGYVLWTSTEAWAAGAHGAQCAIYATPTGSGSAISHIVFKDSYVQVPYRIAAGTTGLVPSYPLHVASTVGTTGASDTAGFIQDIATAADAAQTRRGLTGSVNYTAGAGAISVANAIQGSLTVAAGGTATTGYPFTTSVTGSGTVTTLAHYSTVDPTTPTITTQYGYYCPSLVKATTNYAFYAAGTTKSYFGGNVGINKTAPTSLLHVEGTATYSGTGMVNFTYTVNPAGVFEPAVACIAKTTTATAYGTYCLGAVSEAIHTSGTVGGVTPVYAKAKTSGAGGTTTNCFGVYSVAEIGAGTTATNAACFYAANNIGAGVPQFQYGLYIEPLTTAGFANYGIFSRMASPYYTLWSDTTGVIYHRGQTSFGVDGSTYTDAWLSVAERQPQLLYLRNTTAGGDSGGGQIIIGSNGTAGSNYTKSGDWISLIGSRGVISTGWEGSSVAALIAAATENHTTTNKGTRYAIETTQTTTTTRAEKLGVEHDGVITQTLRGLATKLSGTLFSQTATSTTTANSLTTMLGTGVGTLTLPANFLMAGRGIRVTVGGYVSTADGGAGTKTITFSIGGVTVATATSGATFTNVLNAGWEASAWFTLYTTGAPGTGWGGAKWGSQIASAAPTAVVATVTSAAAITTTGTLAIDFKYNNGNATGVLTTTYAHVEVIGAV